MRHQGSVRFTRPVHRSLLHRCDPVRDLRCGNHLPVSVGCALPGTGVVRSGGSVRLSRHSDRRLHMGLQKGCFGVGLKNRLLPAFLLFTFANLLSAAPTLRLVSSTVGPIAVPTGGTAPLQTVEAYNIGDGSLALTTAV